MPFELLSHAIRHALMSADPRYPQAIIVTKSGARYGWNAIWFD